MHRQPEPKPDLLTPAAVAAVFFVDPKTVTRWATAGKLTAIRTPGGHRRFRKSDVMALIDPVNADFDRLTVPCLSEAPPGSAAASAAALLAEAAAVALEAEAHMATDAVVRAALVLDKANAEATLAARDAHQARVLATVHAAYADSTANVLSFRGSAHRFPVPAIAPPDAVIPQQRNRTEP